MNGLIERVILFGSRALGNFKHNYGDIAHLPLKRHTDQFGIEIYRRE